MFPEIKIKGGDEGRVKQLKNELFSLKPIILNYAPSYFTGKNLDKLKIRIFKFSKKEGCNEFFATRGRSKYVCLNSSLVSRRYYASLQYLLHGIAHSFSHFRNGLAEEIFCEFVSYSILQQHLNRKGRKFSRKIMKSIMSVSSKDYNSFYRVARKLNKKQEFILRLNILAKNRKLSKKNEKKVFAKMLKSKKYEEDGNEAVPELERGFRKI